MLRRGRRFESDSLGRETVNGSLVNTFFEILEDIESSSGIGLLWKKGNQLVFADGSYEDLYYARVDYDFDTCSLFYLKEVDCEVLSIVHSDRKPILDNDIFCIDTEKDDNNKYSWIGVYDGTMYNHKLVRQRNITFSGIESINKLKKYLGV